MSDQKKTKKQLISELEEMRRHVAELKAPGTERERAEGALQGALEKLEQFRNIIDRSPALVFVWRVAPGEWPVELASDNVERVLGYTADDFMSGRVSWPGITHPEDVPRLEEEVAQHLEEEEAEWSQEYRLITKSGKIRWFTDRNLALSDSSGKVTRIQSILLDVTERKRAEEALRLTQFSMDHAEDAAFWMGPDARFVYVNEAACRSLGYSREELLTMSVHDMDPDFPKEIWPQHWCEIMERGSFRFESHHRRKDGRVFPVEVAVNYLEHDGGQYSCAFARDITERKRAEEALRESEDRFSTAFHSSPTLMAITRMDDGCIVNINDSFATALGYSREGIIGRSTVEVGIWGSIENRSVFTREIEQHGRVKNFEIAVPVKSGETRFGIVSAEEINLNGEPHLITVATDITERKRTEESLEETNQLLETILNSTHMLVAYMDTEFNFIRVNRAYARADEREPAFFPGKNHFDLYPNSENEEVFRRTVETGEPYFASAKPFEYAEHPERGVTYWDWSLIPIQEPEGTVSGLVLTLVNITDRKRAEDLVAAQRDLAVALNAAVDLDEGLRLCVETALDISGMDCGGVYLIDESSGGLDLAFHQGLSPGFVGNISRFGPDTPNARLVTAGAPVYGGYPELGVPLGRAERREGLRAIAVIPIKYEGRVIGCLNVAAHTRDQVPAYAGVALENIAAQIGSAIARLRTGQELRESEEKYRELVENMNEVIYSINRNGLVSYVSPAVQSITGYVPSELLGRPFSQFMCEDDLPLVRERFEQVLAGNVVAGEYRLLNKSGELRWIITSSKPIHDGDRVIGLQGVLTDITERKCAEEALRESEERYRAVFEQSASSVVLIHVQSGALVEFNDRAYENLGYTREEFKELRIRDFEVIESPEDVVAHVDRIVKKGWDSFETKHRTKNGDIRDIMVNGRAISFRGASYILAIWHDITERKRTEEALRESEERLRGILLSLHEAIILVYDRDAHYVSFWGPSDLEQRYGISPEDFEGKLVTDVELLPTELATKRLGNIKHIVETGEPVRDEYPLQLPGGKFWFDVSLCPMRGTSGQVTGVVAFIRDITERKSAERELERSRRELRNLSTHLQSVREEERAGVAREIHDELGQSLTALKMDLSWLGRKVPKDETVSEKVRSMTTLIDTTIQEVRKISSELRPGLLDDLGLIAAIEWQIEHFEHRTGIKCEFVCNQRDMMFGKEVSTAIFRILQETLTNVTRHASATSVEVSLSKKHGSLLLDVRDNGRGIASEQIADPAGYGILGMRERALHLGGRLGIAGTPGRGTVVTVNIPLEGGGETKS